MRKSEVESTPLGKKNKEEHGFGLKNVQKMVEKHNGIMEAYANGKRFFVKLILYI